MEVVFILLLALAAVCFLGAAGNVQARVNLVGLGLFLLGPRPADPAADRRDPVTPGVLHAM